MILSLRNKISGWFINFLLKVSHYFDKFIPVAETGFRPNPFFFKKHSL